MGSASLSLSARRPGAAAGPARARGPVRTRLNTASGNLNASSSGLSVLEPPATARRQLELELQVERHLSCTGSDRLQVELKVDSHSGWHCRFGLSSLVGVSECQWPAGTASARPDCTTRSANVTDD